MEYVNFHQHSHFSVLDCVIKVPELVNTIKERGGKYVVLTEHGTLSSAYELWKECKKADLTPILGNEAYFVESYDDDASQDKANYGHVVIFALNETGWKNLKIIHEISWERGYNRRPRVDFDTLFTYNAGLAVTTGCMNGLVGNIYHGKDPKSIDASMPDRLKMIKDRIRKFKRVFGDRLYGEVQLLDLKAQKAQNRVVIRHCRKLGIKILVTLDCHYLKKEDSVIHDAVITYRFKEKLDQAENHTYGTKELWLKTYEELDDIRKRLHDDYISHDDLVEFCSNTLEAAARVERYDIKPKIPVVPTLLSEKTPRSYLEEVCRKHKDWHLVEKSKMYKRRFDYEMDIIDRLKFCDYFVVVHDLVRHAIERKMPYNARGSVCGSLVAYFTDITYIDPIRFDLPFERFLTEDRVSLPDIDMDFGKSCREDMIKYCIKKYGSKSVANICNYTVWKMKNAIKDMAARFTGYDFQKVNNLTKAIDEDVSSINEITDKAVLAYLEQNETLGYLVDNVLGINRQIGIHASGVIVTPTKVTDYVPIAYTTEKTKTEDRRIKVTEWDMYALEDLGILKLDFLGQNTLDIINYCIPLIKKNAKEVIPFDDFYSLYHYVLEHHLEDSKVYDLISKGKLVGMFQLGTSEGMHDLTVKFKPREIDDILVIISLYRTAILTSGMHTEYVKRRNGARYKYIHKKMGDVLDSTYGILLFQEQTMKLAVVLAGFTETESDYFRKAIKLKDRDKIKVWLDKFVSGCNRVSGIKESDALEIWKFIEDFSLYGFNKCLTGDTEIYRGNIAYKGQKTTIEHLYKLMHDNKYVKESGKGYLANKLRGCGYGSILAADKDGKIRPKKIKDIMYEGVKPVYRMTLDNGYSIEATENHKFLTSDGWKNVSDIIVGIDSVAVRGGIDTDSYIRSSKKSLKRSTVISIASESTYEGCGFPTGNDNPGYVDGKSALFKKNRRMMRDKYKSCCICSGTKRLEVHHVDGNDDNHILSNLTVLCSSCHKKADYALGKRRGQWKVGRLIDYSAVKSIDYVGYKEVYDISMDSEEFDLQNFVANGIISHNSHAATYAVVAYVTAWLKVYYPKEFMTSLLTHNVDDSDKTYMYLKECKSLNIKVLPPDINSSTDCFTLANRGILYPITAIKQCADRSAADIIAVRKKQKFTSFEDFFNRINKRITNVRVITNMILAGCFNKFGKREEIYDKFIGMRKDKVSRQVYCNDCARRYVISNETAICPKCGGVNCTTDVKICTGKPFDINFLKTSIYGFSISSDNPLKQYADIIATSRAQKLSVVETVPENFMVTVAFQVKKVKTFYDKNKNEMAFLDVADSETELSVTFFTSDWVRLKSAIKAGNCYIARLSKNRSGFLFSSRSKSWITQLLQNAKGYGDILK